MAPTILSHLWALFAITLFAAVASGQRALFSDSFDTCVDNSQLTASFFNVSITPDNNTIAYDLSGTTKFSGNATFEFTVTVDSQQVFRYTMDPCLSTGSAQFCPASPGQLVLSSNIDAPTKQLDRVPDDVYTTSKPDAYFRMMLINVSTNQTEGCLQANLTNSDASTSNDTASSSNTTDSGNVTATDGSSTMNSTDNSNSTGNGNGQSAASTVYLSWTLLLCGTMVMGFSNSI